MADSKGNLYLFEAIELRHQYDETIRLIADLLADQNSDNFYGGSRSEEREPVSDFDVSQFQDRLKSLKTKRVKLNQAIQEANFKYEIDFDSETISLSEALEIRKNLLVQKNETFQQVKESAYRRIIHKEERDVVHSARYSFRDSYKQYLNISDRIKDLINKIHVKNHESVVNFRDE